MNVLEKILEEIIDELKEEGIIVDNERGHRAVNIIRSHTDETSNNEWISTSERLPNEEDFVKAYCRNHYCAEFIVMIEGATRPTTLYYKNGIWADEINNHYRVVAWQPLPEPYKPEEGINT